MIHCLNTSRRIEAATRLNRRFSKSRLMLCSPQIKEADSTPDAQHECRVWLRWPYHPCPATERILVSFGIDENASNGSSRTSQVGDNTYATTVGRLKYPWLNAAYLKARCSDRCISSFLQQMSSVSLTSTASPFMDMPMTCRSTTTVSSTESAESPPHIPSRLADCIDSIGVWMKNNRLKLNASKTEFIWFGSARRLARCTFESIVINGSSILPSKTVRSLGVVLDTSLSLASHVTKLTSTLYFHIRQLRTIRWTLTNDACHALVRALVLSRLDYCNGLRTKHRTIFWLNCPMWCVLLPGSSSSYLEKVTFSDAIRRQLHWLDISERVRFKLCVLARRCIHGLAPSYLSRYCIPVSSIAGRSHIRSAASGDLFIPATNTVTIGPRAFAVACPAAWNSLPPELHAWQKHESDDVQKNWKLIYSKSTSKLLCDFGAWCKLLLTMLLWLS